MGLSRRDVTAIGFDFGNTLIPFGPEQVTAQYATLVATLCDMFGDCDANRLKAVRDRQIVAPYSNGYRENHMPTICAELIQGIYGVDPDDRHVERLVQTRYRSFVDSVRLPAGLPSLLERLRRRYRLAVLSNYPCARSIRDSIDEIGITDMFVAIVVSGDVGYVKPHPKPFEAMLSQLEVPPSECVYVGDNWLADVQGAKRMGMGAILTTEHAPYEKFEPGEGDFEPDARVCALDGLVPLLLQDGSA